MSFTNDRLSDQAVKLREDLRDMGGIVKDAAQETLGQVRENATEYYGQGRDKVRGAMATCEHFVQQRPVQSILVAAVIGVLFGRFAMRR